jgi:hypothetical protein
MDLLTKYKLYLIDNSLEFNEWKLCQELLGILGKIEYDKDVYFDGKFMYKYDSKNSELILSHQHIWSFFEDKFNMEYTDIQQVISLYVEETYKLKVINNMFPIKVPSF